MNQLKSVELGVKTPWGPLGFIVYKRTYSRRLNDYDVNSETEEFTDTVDRVVNACNTQLNVGFTEEEQKRLAEIMLTLKGTVAGRFLWQLGTKTVDKLGFLSLQNCAFTVVDHPVKPFVWAFDALMLGCGVGFSIQRKHVYKLPKVKYVNKIERVDKADADFIVPDSREGWIKVLSKVLKSHFYSGQGFTYSTQLIRSAGAPIKGFGGVSSGPEQLVWGLNEIHLLLNKRAGDYIRPIDALDIMNIIAQIVVSGNVRRSAQIAIGDYDDLEYLEAKVWQKPNDPDWFIPHWRTNSNNSVICDDITKLPDKFWETYANGEPYGLINIELSKKIGRIGETQYPDPDVEGFNPCAEQSLADKETCCLAEIFLPNISSKEELFEVATYLYRINKHSLALPSHLKDTEAIVHKNMRMGIGITGVLQATDEQRSWLSDTYLKLREYDTFYSKLKGFPTSIKLTTVKPSGTLNLLAGVTPGAHPSPAGPYYIRRMRIASNSPLLPVLKKHGFPIEADIYHGQGTQIVSFPIKVPQGVPIEADVTAIEQLETVKWLQSVWSDNAVSVTVYYTLQELPQIKEWLQNNYKHNVKSVSFLLRANHGFKQAPYETITEEFYNKLSKDIIPITSLSKFDENDLEVEECASGACPIK